MLGVLPFVEDLDLSWSAAPALPQLLPPSIIIIITIVILNHHHHNHYQAPNSLSHLR